MHGHIITLNWQCKKLNELDFLNKTVSKILKIICQKNLIVYFFLFFNFWKGNGFRVSTILPNTAEWKTGTREYFVRSGLFAGHLRFSSTNRWTWEQRRGRTWTQYGQDAFCEILLQRYKRKTPGRSVIAIDLFSVDRFRTVNHTRRRCKIRSKNRKH